MPTYPQINQASKFHLSKLTCCSSKQLLYSEGHTYAFILAHCHPLSCHQSYISFMLNRTLDQCTSLLDITVIRVVTLTNAPYLKQRCLASMLLLINASSLMQYSYMVCLVSMKLHSHAHIE